MAGNRSVRAAAIAALALMVGGFSVNIQAQADDAATHVPAANIPPKTVVLTFDDAVKSHRTYVAPLLREYGFGATFFVTAAWMDDAEHFMTWQHVAELHKMGFEIGNHSWSHRAFNSAESAETLRDELHKVDEALAEVGVPKPSSFAWPGNAFGPESLAVLRNEGYRFARRGMQPEQPYGEICLGPLYEPERHDPLLVPTAGDAYPDWTFEHFKNVVNRAVTGKAVVLQFHGVPDVAHPWVHTPPDKFEQYMAYLNDEGFNVIALRDLAQYVTPEPVAADPTVQTRYPAE